MREILIADITINLVMRLSYNLSPTEFITLRARRYILKITNIMDTYDFTLFIQPSLHA